MNLPRTKLTASVCLQLSTVICFYYWLADGKETDSNLQHFLQCSAADWFTNTLLQRCGIHDYSLPNVAQLDFNHWKLSSSPQLHQLPVDAEKSNGVRIVRDALFSRSNPTPFAGSVELAAWSDDVLENILDLNVSQACTSRQFVDFVSGNAVHHSSIPLSHRYGGHQFGVWAGQLGDGRAHLLGEYWSTNNGQRWELQLKGSGKTPYSRDGDGRAVLRSSVREFLASEAMHYLGIPSSRAATLVRSSEKVRRDPLYNGRVLWEPTAVVLRVSQSWFRFGSFEILANAGEFELLRTLVDFVIVNHFPTIRKDDEQRYASLFEAVVDLSARTAAKWHGVGFAHGVLNTDNMSLLGLTIDYGPFRFIDGYDPELVPNGSDDEGRYRYRRQPAVVRDNLRYLFVAMASIMSDAERKRAGVHLERFEIIFRNEFVQIGLEKLGFGERPAVNADGEKLVDHLLKMMSDTKSDFTATFRQLSSLPLKRLISASTGDNDAVDSATSSLPWSLQKLVKHERFGQWVLDYRTKLKLSAVGEKRRQRNMRNVNPRYVLRNWMAEEAIAMAESGDYSRVRTLARILRRPFDYDSEAEYLGYSKEPPSWSKNLTVTCSS